MRKSLYLAGVSMFLGALALIAGMTGCAQVPSPLGSPEYPVTHFACGERHTVAVKVDGTAVAAGSNYYYQCDVDDWREIIGITAGYFHTVGLKVGGKVVSAGRNIDGQRDVRYWMDINQIAAGSSHTVGVKFDGTVLATGWNDAGQCDVSEWTDITRVEKGSA